MSLPPVMSLNDCVVGNVGTRKRMCGIKKGDFPGPAVSLVYQLSIMSTTVGQKTVSLGPESTLSLASNLAQWPLALLQQKKCIL